MNTCDPTLLERIADAMHSLLRQREAELAAEGYVFAWLPVLILGIAQNMGASGIAAANGVVMFGVRVGCTMVEVVLGDSVP